MTEPVVGKCWEMVKDNKTTYVGRFLRRLGGGPYNTSMAEYFLRDGKEIEIVSRYPDFHTYNEVPCKNANKSTGGRRRRTRGGGRTKKGTRRLRR